MKIYKVTFGLSVKLKWKQKPLFKSGTANNTQTQKGGVDPHTHGITSGNFLVSLPDGIGMGVTKKDSRIKLIDTEFDDVDLFVYKEELI